MVDGINECEIASVGVGSSGVGEGDSVAADISSVGVAELMGAAGVFEGAITAGPAPSGFGMLHAKTTNIRTKLNVKMKLFFLMGSLLAINYHSFCNPNQ
jgi:hypothetical protein